MPYNTQEKKKIYNKKYYLKHKNEIIRKNFIWNKNSGYKWINSHAWVRCYHNIKLRCNNPNADNYKWYGGRGIKCLITSKELKQLWFRDKAYLMKKPSIDRKDNDGNYIFENCRFIELSKNVAKRNMKSSSKSIN